MVLVVSALLGGLSGCQLFDNGPKTAVINTRDVLTKCNDGLRVVEEIQKQFSYRQEQLKAQDESLQKRRLDPALSDPKSGKKDELQALVQQFLEDSQKLRKDVGDVEAVKFKPVVDKINKALAGYAKAHGLVSVQDKNGFAYIDPSIDITEVIIKQVDQVP
jgi:outer membrane protein